MTLEPGDLVLTGTPAGVAMAHPEPRPYLRHGDLVQADGGVLGRHRNLVVDPSRAAGAASVTPTAGRKGAA
jgi:2-keto-4-pentenoate hydratase/2-oxohepta-3-ene-1,7-dioic acid hydratase in catechol pathway